MHDIELNGIDGGNLLGYLAALGTLRVLTLADPEAEARMSWGEKDCWTPVIHHSAVRGPEELVAALAKSIAPAADVSTKKKGGKKPPVQSDHDTTATDLSFGNINRACAKDYLDLTLTEFGKALGASIREAAHRGDADFFAALGSDCLPEVKDGKLPATTAFRAIGAGNNDGFLGLIRTIHHETTAKHLHKALFRHWDYADPPPFMRWDPNEFRPHALRATDPAKDRMRNNVRGANRLAIEALPLFPTAPQKRHLRTVGFQDRDGETQITWPIWTEQLNLHTVATLLASDAVQEADRFSMARRGVAQVFRSRRFTEGKYRNFSPSKALL